MSTAKEAPTAAAMQAVFQTSELVENILVHLPAKTIFGVQRVSKSFRNAIKNSLPIKEKLFLRPRSTNVHKVIAHGFQHTAAALNPLFIPGAFSENHTVHYMPLPFRTGLHEKYGVTMAHQCVIPIESHALDTYLLDIPFKKLKLSLRLWVGEGGPTVMIDMVDVDAKKPMTIRAMIDSVLDSPQEMGLAFEEKKWRAYDAEFPRACSQPRRVEGNGAGWYANVHYFADFEDAERERKFQQTKRARYIPELLPYQIPRSLLAARKFEREARWRCEAFAKPTEILDELQAVAGPGSRVYVSLSQQPTFLLHDIVIPSPEDWAKIEARDK
jgi:hypothetical protein